ncbi:MAG: DUF4105 domain-containing protein [Bacteroidetes bacterium]|nr:DUF4105 domain-containing protein [Bacteroidota bacterium]
MVVFRKFFIVLFFLFTSCFSFAQPDTCKLQISLLTCGPGEELYSTFGHTAIRVTDTSKRYDVVFNYGTFDDSDPYFYVKFTRGIMRYALSAEPFSDFMQEYISDHRSVDEQILSLSCEEKLKLVNALEENLEEQNRYYNYHFYADNCTTRARDIILKIVSSPVSFKSILPAKHPTYRKLIHSYLDDGNEYWNKLGIDLVLGSTLDVQVSEHQATFLPDYLMHYFDSATYNGRPFVLYKKQILPGKKENSGALLSPFIFFILIAIIILSLSFVKNHWSKLSLNIFDFVFFFTVGLFGILMATVWMFRVDTVCSNNYNLLWAWPLHAIMAFFIKRKQVWIRYYFLCAAGVCGIVLMGWGWWPQQMNKACIPLVAILIIRSFIISRKK